MDIINTHPVMIPTEPALRIRDQLVELGWDVFVEQRFYMIEAFATKRKEHPDRPSGHRVLTVNFVGDLDDRSKGDPLEYALGLVLEQAIECEKISRETGSWGTSPIGAFGSPTVTD